MQSPACDQHTLIHSFIGNFIPRFVSGSVLLYRADQNGKDGCYDAALLKGLGIGTDSHGKLPLLILHDPARNWLLLMESNADKGQIDERRAKELASLFDKAGTELVFVTAYQSRADMADHEELPAWKTHAWFADEPDHMMHFD
jgi:hypothetical protein